MMSKFAERFSKNILEDVGVRDPEQKAKESSPVVGRKRMQNAASIDIDRIEIDPQHREEFDESSIERLSKSLKDHGQLQPIRVRWDEQRETYVLIAGERRLRAMRLAEMKTVDAVIADGDLSDKDILVQQIIENCQREDLKPVERAKAFHDLMKQQDWDGKRLAEELHVSPATVSNSLKLLALDEDTQQQVEEGTISIKAAVSGTRRSQAKTKKRGAKPPKPKTYRMKAGKVIVEPKVNRSYVEALEEALAAAKEAEAPAAKAA